MPTPQIEELLNQTIGMDATAIGRSVIAHAVRVRIGATGSGTTSDYCELLRSSAEELQQLVEEVVVPETWFFRDRESFASLVHLVRQEWLPANPGGALRVLSFPCSTGEEAYSIAMALLDAGLPPERFKVDAVDISERALKRAHEAVYRRNSFRVSDLAFRDRHFHASADGHRLAETVRRQVRFHQANLLSPDLKLRGGAYDFVFCRNALIYFDRAAQEQALGALSRCLAPGGILFVGPAETYLPSSCGFRTTGQKMAFAFRKADVRQKEPRARPRPAAVPPAKVPPPSAKRMLRKRASLQPSEAAPAAAGQIVQCEPGLEAAARLADAGRLREAEEICSIHLQKHGASAAAFYLLGLVRDAMGEAGQAAALYRKAIYLDPGHSEALMHLALLEKKDGEIVRARRLQERARRAGEAAMQ